MPDTKKQTLLQTTAEHKRLLDHHTRDDNWKNWGPYLSERAWGTVREDYSPDGAAWDFFPHDHARSRAYRWNEDGLAGISDRHQYLCFALGLWNGRDEILKERLFGLTNTEGNHGEDVKEIYHYLDSTPTHSYMKLLYKYPQAAFPYDQLIEQNRARGLDQPEYELLDTGVFDESRYFDILVEYAKADPDDICIRITVTNRGPDTAPLTVLPQLWFRNTWSWGYRHGPKGEVDFKPRLEGIFSGDKARGVRAVHPNMREFYLYTDHAERLLFTENDTNQQLLFDKANPTPYVKDAFHRYVVGGETNAVNAGHTGTKAAALYRLELAPGETREIKLRLANGAKKTPYAAFSKVMTDRTHEADEFYAAVQNPKLTDEQKQIQRQALAGMLWTKQFYYLDMEQWLDGDLDVNQPPTASDARRNAKWRHLNNYDILSMPDKWEFPWYATWDLAFHTVPLALVDPDFAKRQLTLVTREWYMHPNGQLPAYEWAFGDVNPPMHAWAAWQVYEIDARKTGRKDRLFLESLFHKLLMNFTWWVNRKDAEETNVFQGGFLGMDNIGVFDRSAELPGGGHLDQADGTSWMAAYCLWMLKIALELAETNPVYEDTASKFFEHFLRIAHAMTRFGHHGHSLWDAHDNFFYDLLHTPDGNVIPLKVRSLVGLLPIMAVEVFNRRTLEKHPAFLERMEWFLTNRAHFNKDYMHSIEDPGDNARRVFAILTEERLKKVLAYMLDEAEFLSPYGIRSLSKYHAAHPYSFELEGKTFSVGYEPGESHNDLFGGNSNWRGPIWMPINYLLIDALEKFHRYYGPGFKVEYPTGSGNLKNLHDIAVDLAGRLRALFENDPTGHRPIFGPRKLQQHDPHWRDNLLFNEYFHGDTGQGLGASHQTGWTGLIANLLQNYGE
jgi:hypothetical protein